MVKTDLTVKSREQDNVMSNSAKLAKSPIHSPEPDQISEKIDDYYEENSFGD